MKITSVTTKDVMEKGKLRAFATVVFDDQFALHDIKVIKGDKGWFIAMPSRFNPSDGKYIDICHPLNQETRLYIQETILDYYLGRK